MCEFTDDTGEGRRGDVVRCETKFAEHVSYISFGDVLLRAPTR